MKHQTIPERTASGHFAPHWSKSWCGKWRNNTNMPVQIKVVISFLNSCPVFLDFWRVSTKANGCGVYWPIVSNRLHPFHWKPSECSDDSQVFVPLRTQSRTKCCHVHCPFPFLGSNVIAASHPQPKAISSTWRFLDYNFALLGRSRENY